MAIAAKAIVTGSRILWNGAISFGSRLIHGNEPWADALRRRQGLTRTMKALGFTAKKEQP